MILQHKCFIRLWALKLVSMSQDFEVRLMSGAYFCLNSHGYSDYRPPIQDGPPASSHSTEVPSVAILVVACDAPRRFDIPASLKKRAAVRLVMDVLLREPINVDDLSILFVMMRLERSLNTLLVQKGKVSCKIAEETSSTACGCPIRTSGELRRTILRGLHKRLVLATIPGI